MKRNDKAETGVSFLVALTIHIIIVLLLPGIAKQVEIEKEPEKIEVIQANFIKIKSKTENRVQVEKSTETTTVAKQSDKGIHNSNALPIPAKLDLNPIAQPISTLPTLAMPSISSKTNDYSVPLPASKNDAKKGGSEVGTRVKDKDLTSNIKINDTGTSDGKEERIPIKLDIPIDKESDKVSIKNSDINVEGSISDVDSSPQGTKKEIQLVSGDGALGKIVAADPVYPEIAKKNGWYGEVVLMLVVGDDARVQEVFVEQKSGYAVLDDTAKKASYRWKIPIVKNGIQIKGKVRATINFVLK